MNIGCVNVRSIKNKTTTFLDNIVDDKLNLCMITETLLNHKFDVIRTAITPDTCTFLNYPHSNDIGGGTALLARTTLRPMLIRSGETISFEFLEYSITFNNSIISVLVLYQPPFQLESFIIGVFHEKFTY